MDRMLGLKGAGCDSVCCDTGCSADPTCGVEMSACGGGCEPTCGVEMSACGSCDSGCGLGSKLRNHFAAKSACAAPTCGCEIAGPTCGVEMSACGGGCGAGPSCGCEIASDPCCKPRRKPLLELLGRIECKKKAFFGSLCSSSSCDSGCGAGPTCGCEIASCDPTCGVEMSGCGAGPSCGCEIASCDTGCDSGCGTKKCGGLLSRLFKKKSSSCCDAVVCDSGCSSCGTSVAAPVAAPVVNGEAAPMPPAPIVDPSAYLQSNRRVIQATSYVR